MKQPTLPRELSLAARPEKLPTVRREPADNGKISLTVRLARSTWQRWLGAGETAEKTFVLDRFGQEVYEACDGANNVQSIIQRFARAHQVSLAEAETAVATFLRTLMTKGLIAMSIERR
jgi:hypothetical protein